ncbi:MAG: VCBS repeat-containing protein [Clostridia bacterium]|nr:VCBS repeat-containing protein [Clostridia bacterium]
MARKIICLGLVFLIGIMLCGCDFLAADPAELLTPPALSGELNPIADVIKQTAGENYVFKYPSRGNYRSAVIREDINGDGLLEAFAFYSTYENENTTMNLNYIGLDGSSWQSFAVQKIVAGSVDMLDFYDLDNDGIKELIVGWQIYGTSEMQLAVYNLENETLTQRMLERYTHFLVCDLNEDSKREILIINANTAESKNSASIFELTNDGVTEVSSCELDSASKTFSEPILSNLSNGKPAVYIDEIKGVGAVTEVLYFDKGKLLNPLYSPDTKETLLTLRSASFSTTDINGDNILEIPVQKDVPSVTRSDLNEKLYLTQWCSFGGENLVCQQTDMINVVDGFAYTIPDKWTDSIAVLKDTDRGIREIYRYDKEEAVVGESLIYFKTVKLSDWETGKHKNEKLSEIMTNNSSVFTCRISDSAKKEGITLEKVKAAFKLYE